jgi:hypothetical protein
MPFEKPALVATSDHPIGNVSDLGGYYNQLSYFCSQLRVSKKPEIATGRQALESLRVVLAEIQSASQHQAIRLN